MGVGLRWVLFKEDVMREVSQDHPYYFRLSEDSDFGYEGTWAVDRGFYPPPQVSLVQTLTCFRCPGGWYSIGGSTECSRCPAGFYSLGGADSCTACQNGTF